MTCSLFVDDTRKCTEEVKSVPVATYDFCMSEIYKDCSFFRVLNKIGHTCENIKDCSLYSHFKMGGFEKFVEITKQYCLSENNVNCKIYVLKKSGGIVPIDLHPDGGWL